MSEKPINNFEVPLENVHGVMINNSEDSARSLFLSLQMGRKFKTEDRNNIFQFSAQLH
jgi:hypothetical protein